MKYTYPVSAFLLQYLTQASAGGNQVILGPEFETPTNLPSNPLVKSAASSIIDRIQDAIKHGETSFNQPIDNGTALSLTISTSDGTLLDFHHTPKELKATAGSVSHVSANSVYRIGSISKLFTVYLLLMNSGRKYWDSPVGDLVPELKLSQWKDVTIGALASQLGGIGRDFNNGDLASLDFPYQEAGMPVLSPSERPQCSGGPDKPCNRKEYFKGYLKRDLVYEPYTTPIYSNAAYRILGYAIAAITKTSYEDTLTKAMKSLKLGRTSFNRPTKSKTGVIPNGNSGWFLDEGDETPTGGIFSSSRDLANFGLSILQNKQLSAFETRQWMKPVSHTASLKFAVGAPWEIVRVESRGRIIDVYTKSGSVNLYSSLLLLIPEYGVSIAIFSAGATSAQLQSMAADQALKLLPVFEDVAKKQACDKYCGTYEYKDSKLVLTTDNKQGLLVDKWISRGKDVIKAAQAYSTSTRGGKLVDFRLYPTNEGSYRVVIQKQSDLGGVMDDPVAGPWGGIDAIMYGNVAIDEFILDGKSATPKVMKQTLRKK